MKNDVVEELFIKYYNDALLYVLSLSRNKALAEDAVSTAFFKALRGGDDEIKNFKPWLMKVCRNVCFDMLKHRKRYAALDESKAYKALHFRELFRIFDYSSRIQPYFRTVR